MLMPVQSDYTKSLIYEARVSDVIRVVNLLRFFFERCITAVKRRRWFTASLQCHVS